MFCTVILSLLQIFALGAVASSNWPQFRGPQGDGHSDASRLPTPWSETENVLWQTSIPGAGWSSPAVWGETLWMATATEEGHFLFGMYGAACPDRSSGAAIWKNTDLSHDHGKNGPGSSPALQGNLLFLTCDGTEKRYVTALDTKTGKRVWTTPRSNRAQLEGKVGDLKEAYDTPLVIAVNGDDELISTGAFRVSGFDPKTGKEFKVIARNRLGDGLMASPAVADQALFLRSKTKLYRVEARAVPGS